MVAQELQLIRLEIEATLQRSEAALTRSQKLLERTSRVAQPFVPQPERLDPRTEGDPG